MTTCRFVGLMILAIALLSLAGVEHKTVAAPAPPPVCDQCVCKEMEGWRFLIKGTTSYRGLREVHLDQSSTVQRHSLPTTIYAAPFCDPDYIRSTGNSYPQFSYESLPLACQNNVNGETTECYVPVDYANFVNSLTPVDQKLCGD
jgi:hypothetical protein